MGNGHIPSSMPQSATKGDTTAPMPSCTVAPMQREIGTCGTAIEALVQGSNNNGAAPTHSSEPTTTP